MAADIPQTRRANVWRAELEFDDRDPDGYRSGVALVGRIAGGRATTVKVYEVPIGEAICPYHYEFEEEWLLVLDGALTLRHTRGESPLQRGDLVCFPPGPEGAHKVINTGGAPARVLMFSSSREPAVAVYPDSDKVGVWPGNDADSLMVRRVDGAVDYWDGEL